MRPELKFVESQVTFNNQPTSAAVSILDLSWYLNLNQGVTNQQRLGRRVTIRKQVLFFDIPGTHLNAVPDAQQAGPTIPYVDKYWIALYYGPDVPTNALFVLVPASGEWLMDPTNPQKKHWRVLKKVKRFSKPMQILSGAGLNGYWYPGYTMKVVLPRAWVAEFASNANGAPNTKPQGPYMIVFSSISPVLAAPRTFMRYISVTTRTYFMDS